MEAIVSLSVCYFRFEGMSRLKPSKKGGVRDQILLFESVEKLWGF